MGGQGLAKKIGGMKKRRGIRREGEEGALSRKWEGGGGGPPFFLFFSRVESGRRAADARNF